MSVLRYQNLKNQKIEKKAEFENKKAKDEKKVKNLPLNYGNVILPSNSVPVLERQSSSFRNISREKSVTSKPVYYNQDIEYTIKGQFSHLSDKLELENMQV